MLLTVFIPTYHRNDDLAKCLQRLAPGMQAQGFLIAPGHHDLPRSRPCESSFSYEVIVTDDGRESTAESMIAAHFPWARWVSGPQRGPAANRNNGAKHSCGDWLVFLDDDCIPNGNILYSYYAQTQKCSDSCVLEGRIFVDRPRLRMDEVAQLNETGGKLWSCNFAISRKAYFYVGGFNESFPFACLEDTDLRYALEASGATILFVSSAAVMHPWRRFTQASLQYCKIREVSYSILVSRWPNHHKPLRVRLLIVAKHVQLFIVEAFRFRMCGVTGAFNKLLGDVLFLAFYATHQVSKS
jgi:GT2 family glycosyltransferase